MFPVSATASMRYARHEQITVNERCTGITDAQILAEVYLAMTGGQTSMAFAMEGEDTTATR